MLKKMLIYVLILNILFISTCYAEAEYDGYIVKFRESDEVALFAATNTDNDLIAINASKNLYMADSAEEAERYTDAGIAEYVEPNYIVTLFDNLFSPADKRYPGYQYGALATYASSAWNMGIFGNDVIIGCIDSGVYPHNDLVNNTFQGYDYTVDDSICSNGADCTDTACAHYTPTDTYGHGTFCAGIMVAEANTTDIIGITPAAKLVPLRTFVEKNGTISDIAAAIYAAADKYGCDVINMSFGLETNSATLRNAIAYAKSKNVLMVAAAGNSNKNVTNYPGGYDGVICVGSVTASGEKSSFSNYGSYVTLSAPGTGIYSCSLATSGTRSDSGTSFSTPYVSSAAAICRMLEPDMTYEEFETLLASTCKPYADDFAYELGYGILNIENIVNSLMKDKENYFSPISRLNGETFRIITNFSETDMTFANLWKSGNAFEYNNVTVSANSGYRTDFSGEGDSFVNYIWESILNLKPINKAEY